MVTYQSTTPALRNTIQYSAGQGTLPSGARSSIIKLKQNCGKLEEKCQQLEQYLELHTEQPSNEVHSDSSELSQPEENITTLQSVQSFFIRSWHQRMSSWKVSSTVLSWLEANQSMFLLQSLKSEKNLSCTNNEALLTEKAQLDHDHQLLMMQSKQSDQEMVHNEKGMSIFRSNLRHWR